MNRLLNLLTLWFSNVRWHELAGAMSAGFGGGVYMAQQLHADAQKQVLVGAAAAALAAICYLRNPKTLEWIEKVPQAELPSDAVPSIPVDPGHNPFGDGKGGEV